jgi:hypothetical protein
VNEIASTPSPGRIFISYRREEAAYPAGWLYDRLVEHYGAEQVFKDVDSIRLGADFVDSITAAVGACDVLLALIGDEWLTCTDEGGQRRLDDPSDFVRLEIEAALSRDVLVIPILIDAAVMPTPGELPSSMSRLVRRQALELSPTRFDFDTGRLLKALDTSLREARAAQPTTGGAEGSRAAEPSARESEPGHRDDEKRLLVRTVAESSVTTSSAPPDATAPGKPGTRRTQIPGRAWVGVAVAAVAVVAAAVVLVSRDGSPATTGAVIFKDDFSGDAPGWAPLGSESARGDYRDGRFRVTAEPVPDGSSPGMAPLNVSAVYPTAGSAVRLQVDVRRIAGRQDTGFGLGCRMGDGVGYAFLIWYDESNRPYAAIWKVLDRSPFIKPLKESPVAGFDARGQNRLAAECSGEEGQGGVRLLFSVNGTKLNAADTDQPLGRGTVALMVGTGEDASGPIQAQFDNFVVTDPR